MLKKVVFLAVLGTALSVAPAFAQEPRVTVDFTVGWSVADGVSGDPRVILGVGTFDRVDPKDSFKWGFGVGALIGENAEVGFLYGQAASTLEISGPTQTIDVGDMKINNYHAYFQYNFGDNQTKVRPYIMGGMGATSFGSVDYTNVLGLAASTQSQYQILDDVGCWRQVHGQSPRRRPIGRPVDADVHQDRRGWLVV